MPKKPSYEQLEKRCSELENENRKLNKLYEAATAISSDFSLENTLQSIAGHIAKVLDSRGCEILFWHREKNQLKVLIDYSESCPDQADKPGRTYDLDKFPGSLHALVTNQTLHVRIDDPAADKPEIVLMKEQGLFESLSLPLTADNQVLGLLEIYDDAELKKFTKQEVRLAEALAFQAAIALKNAHLYEAAQSEINNRKRAEEALRESEEKFARSKKMESLGLLAGGVAHDLNNVLSGIVSYPELLLMDLPENSKLRKPIETIHETGLRAAAIVQDLLTVARGVAIVKEPMNLNAIVENFILSPEFEKIKDPHPAVTIETRLDADLFNIYGSEAHHSKIVMNLVSNASEAIEGSGNVIISTMNRYVDKPLKGYDDVTEGEYAVLVVTDDGPGIAPDDLGRIFEPFYTKKVMGRSGTGLGLAVVWNVVQDHKGYIDVISDENGTDFELYFPITRDEISLKDLQTGIKDYQGDGESILVVDDIESQREISCIMLDTLGYETKAVSSGEEAVEFSKKHPVDLLLLDMIMDPGINGRETYERIIKIRPKQKAVIASGFAETEDVKEAQKLGAGKYIRKPLTLEKIGLAVKEELEK
jgi:signal transduction histidine kinase